MSITVDIRAVQHMLGHKSIKTTEKHYGEVITPEGSIVSVVGEPDTSRLIPVRWGDRDVFVFEQDLRVASQQE